MALTSNRKVSSEMNVSERDVVLQELSKNAPVQSTCFPSCCPSPRAGNGSAGQRIERKHATIAGDLEDAAVTVLEAVKLLSEVEREFSETRR